MKRSKSSSRWLNEHVNDPYVKQAQKDGYRSRAAYKLIEINEKDKLIRPGMLMMDLGSAPGGWSQIAGRMVGATGRVIASDILPMDSLDNVDFIQGDFTDDKVFQQILDLLDGRRPDLIVSDIAPNISGVGVADQAASMYLVELVLDMPDRCSNLAATSSPRCFRARVRMSTCATYGVPSRRSWCASRQPRVRVRVRCTSSPRASRATLSKDQFARPRGVCAEPACARRSVMRLRRGGLRGKWPA